MFNQNVSHLQCYSFTHTKIISKLPRRIRFFTQALIECGWLKKQGALFFEN